MNYYVRSADGEWLLASLEPGEQLQVECGAVQVCIGLTDVYADTGPPAG